MNDLTGLTDKQLRLYAIRCARRVQHLMQDRLGAIAALETAESYIIGHADEHELSASRDIARNVAKNAINDFTWYAAGAAPLAAAAATASDARQAAKDASWHAAMAAAWEAAEGVKGENSAAAWKAAWNEEIKVQAQILNEVKEVIL